MRALPVADPGTPDIRSASHYLWWLVREQRRTIMLGMLYGIVWMVAPALVPAAIGHAIDDGIAAGDVPALARWAAVVLGLVLIQAVAGVLRHRMAVFNWLSGSYRTVQLTVRQSTRLGATLGKRIATGEVVSIGTSDLSHIGHALDVTARASGALVAVVVVAAILLHTSVPLGLVVILGAPLFTGIATLLIRPLHKRQQANRELQGALTGRAADIVTGLRVLRGVGGEETFAARYAAQSQELRASGVQVAKVESYLSGAEILIPGLFVALVTWLAARFALAGDISAGQLVALYGYATFLTLPLRTLTEAVDKFTRGHVAARRVVRMLNLEPEMTTSHGLRTVDTSGDLVDVESGLVIRPGQLTAVAAATPEEAVAVCERIGRYAPGRVTLGGVPLAELDDRVRRDTILVADNAARIFSGPLRVELDPRGTASDRELHQALAAASATDIVEALPGGLDEFVAERGREFSGGQQQRLRLARALVVDPPILVLVEPTSAVDAHTEARIADALTAARAGRTTVVVTSSPLLLDRADHVCYLHGGVLVAQGSHRDLLRSEPRYESAVTRGED